MQGSSVVFLLNLNLLSNIRLNCCPQHDVVHTKCYWSSIACIFFLFQVFCNFRILIILVFPKLMFCQKPWNITRDLQLVHK